MLFYIHENFIVRPQICFDNSIEMQAVLLLSIKPKKENSRKSLSLQSYPCRLSDGSFNSVLKKCYFSEKLYSVLALHMFKYERKEERKT